MSELTDVLHQAIDICARIRRRYELQSEGGRLAEAHGAEACEVALKALLHKYESQSPAPAVEGEAKELLRRIDAAITRITTGSAPMRVPVDPTDPDVVLADCEKFIKELSQEQSCRASGEWVRVPREPTITARRFLEGKTGVEWLEGWKALVDKFAAPKGE